MVRPLAPIDAPCLKRFGTRLGAVGPKTESAARVGLVLEAGRHVTGSNRKDCCGLPPGFREAIGAMHPMLFVIQVDGKQSVPEVVDWLMLFAIDVYISRSMSACALRVGYMFRPSRAGCTGVSMYHAFSQSEANKSTP